MIFSPKHLPLSSFYRLQIRDGAANKLLLAPCSSLQGGKASLPLWPLQCTASPRLMKLLLAYGAENRGIEHYHMLDGSNLSMYPMVAAKTWKAETIAWVLPMKAKIDLFLDSLNQDRPDLHILLLRKFKLNEIVEIPGFSWRDLAKPVEPGFSSPPSFPPIYLTTKSTKIKIGYYQARALALTAALLGFGKQTEAGQPTPQSIKVSEAFLVFGANTYYLTDPISLTMAKLKLLQKSQISYPLEKNVEWLTDPRDLVLDCLLTLSTKDGRVFYLQCLEDHRDEYEAGISIAYSFY